MQKAKAQEADADATIAQKQVDLTKNQVSEDALKLQRSLRQLSAARDVAKLEWEVSQGDLEGVKAGCKPETPIRGTSRMPNSTPTTSTPPTSTAEFELSRAELQLLRLTGELENWAIPPQ